MRAAKRIRERLKGIAHRFPLLLSVWRRWRNPDTHALHRSLARGSGLAVLQPFTTTAEDRYPALFDALAERLGDKPNPRILSFGCSGGEEVRALRHRLPHATIVGVDVNPRALDRARRKDRHQRSAYLIGDRPPPGEPFDAILALAVFRHGVLEQDRPDSCAGVLTFAQVAGAVARLDAALAPGGWLAIGNVNYALDELLPPDRFELEEGAGKPPLSDIVYGPDDRLLPGGTERGGLYRKRA